MAPLPFVRPGIQRTKSAVIDMRSHDAEPGYIYNLLILNNFLKNLIQANVL